MSDALYRFQVGDFRCTVLNDGSGTMPGSPIDGYFAHGPREEVEQVMIERGIPLDVIPNHINCLLLQTDTQTILIDTGLGHEAQPEMGHVLAQLREAGVAPENVDHIIISHAHGDHICGLTDVDCEPLFPNAQLAIWRGEWDYWTSDEKLAQLDEIRARRIRDNLLAQSDRFVFVDSPNAEILPGICAIPTPGHTPGHMALLIQSRGEKLIYTGDAVLHFLHFEYPEWSAFFDADAELAAVSRRQLGARIVVEDAPVLVYHLPYPGLGRLTPKGDTWAWETIA